MSKFDPPSDPFGDEKSCPLCDAPLEYNWLTKEWECIRNHDPEEENIGNKDLSE